MEHNRLMLRTRSTYLKTAQSIKASGLAKKDMGLESRLGLMEQDMRVSG
jgi:hypothetical protein